VNLRPTSKAVHSRVYSSRTTKNFKARPLIVRSKMKSTDHTWFLWSADRDRSVQNQNSDRREANRQNASYASTLLGSVPAFRGLALTLHLEETGIRLRLAPTFPVDFVFWFSCLLRLKLFYPRTISPGRRIRRPRAKIEIQGWFGERHSR